MGSSHPQSINQTRHNQPQLKCVPRVVVAVVEAEGVAVAGDGLVEVLVAHVPSEVERCS